MERWRKGIQNSVVEEEGSEVWRIGDRYVRGVNWTLTPDDIYRLREGRLCINCMEPQETPFPERCALCQYPIRDDQIRRFTVEYQGWKDVGPETTDAEEVERLTQETERKRSRIWTP